MTADVAAAIKEQFRSADVNRTGMIGRSKLRRLFLHLGGNWSDRELDLMLAAVDKRCDGMIDYADFVDWITAVEKTEASKPEKEENRVLMDGVQKVVAEDEEEEGAQFPPGPLQGGDYVWKPEAPVKVFKTSFGSVEGDPGELFHEVPELTLTRFLGSGAEGTVYQASYRAAGGDAAVCAVKFAGAFPDHSPDTHAAVDLLTQRRGGRTFQAYEREKRAFELLRPRSEAQRQAFACGSVRLAQFVGFHDAGQALLSELYEGGRAERDPALLESVREFLRQVEAETHVEVGDIKIDNLLRDKEGFTRVIDFGLCHYTGGATCRICKLQVESEIDSHAQEHVADYFQHRGKPGPVVRLRLQDFCYGQSFC